MTSYIRRLVSGAKARFVDPDTALELDLVYVTPRLIIMGYPASGMEGLYRNKREDVQTFLQARHPKSFFVWNFCPLTESGGGYPDNVFEGRVSRYPWPDHHAPPLAYLPLIAREIKTWLDGEPTRVAVVHCKAGKGRSGTIACAYLLLEMALNKIQYPLPGSHEVSDKHTDEVIDAVPTLEDDDTRRVSRPSPSPSNAAVESPMQLSPASTFSIKTAAPASTLMPKSTTQTVSTVASSMLPAADVDTDRTSTSTSRPASVISHRSETQLSSTTEALHNILQLHTSKRMKPAEEGKKVKQGVSIPSQRRWLHYYAHTLSAAAWLPPVDAPAKLRLTSITLRMRPPPRVLRGAVTANIARYDDELITLLEAHAVPELERYKHEKESKIQGARIGQDLFHTGKWDNGKMVKRFGRMTQAGKDKVEGEDEGGKLTTYTLMPPSEGIVVDSTREFRIKVYMGQAFLFWAWFVPAFEWKGLDGHQMLFLPRKSLDFPLGLGKWVVDVSVGMEGIVS